jgi:hypothetical protein
VAAVLVLVLRRCLERLALHATIVPGLESRIVVAGREHRWLCEGLRKLGCWCRLLDSDGRVREVGVCARHVRVGCTARRSAVGLLLGFEVVVEELLVVEMLCGKLLGKVVIGMVERW